jgi:type II secretory pathway component PulK
MASNRPLKVSRIRSYLRWIRRKTLKSPEVAIGRDSSGIALFMVLASVGMLSLLVTEFTYIAQISQLIAYGGLDQTKAHYIAKSGFKLSLLRLKAYQQVKKTIGNMGGGASAMVPKSLLNKIWSFPFIYPIPTNIPGLSLGDKEMIDKFQKESGLDGKLSAIIESESSKYNLNLLLPNLVPTPSPAPSSSATPSQNTALNPTPGAPSPNPTPTAPQATPSFDPQQARNGLEEYLNNILVRKTEVDPDFASMYRDFRIPDLVDNIAAWIDRKYDRRTSNSLDKVPMKRAPFYSISELKMLPIMDDELYKLFAPTLTVSPSSGINVNTMQEGTLIALIPQMLRQEVTDFFKFRDSVDVDNSFKDVDAFYKYLLEKVVAFRGNQQAIDEIKKSLTAKQISLVVEDTDFKITVQAQVNSSIRTIEAWVTLGEPDNLVPSPGASTQPQTPALSGPGATMGDASNKGGNKTGLKITFMKMM